MDSKNKLQSEEDFSSDIKNQTSSNNMTSTIQNILNNQFGSTKIKKLNNITKKKNSKSLPKNIKSQTTMLHKFHHQKNMSKTSPYTFKYFYNTSKRIKAFSNSSLRINSIKEKNNMESNFISLSKNANIYTKNADYIQNKKMLLFDKNDFDNKQYKPDRANIFNMTNIPEIRNKNSTLYKTTLFRGGKLYLNKGQMDKDSDKMKKFRKNVKNKFYENMPINNMIEFIEQNKENLFPKIPKVNTIYDSQEKEKNNSIPYNSLYKELMSKRDEILDSLMSNNINERNKIVIQHQHQPHYYNSSNYNISVMNPKNNSIESNNLNNSSNKLNNSIYKLNNSNSNRFNNSSYKCNNSYKNINNISSNSNLMFRKNNDGIPIIFPIVCSALAKCNSVSQSSRYQNIMDSFNKVKTFIENDKSFGKNNEFEYIREFLINKQIDQKHINSTTLINFSKFLKCEKLPIDLNKSLKENILIALYYDENQPDLNLKTNVRKKKFLSKSRNKFYKRNLLLNNNTNNFKSLVMDLPKQKKLFIKEEGKNNCELNEELKKEINLVENEIKNKQEIIKQVEKNLNLIPLYYSYYNNLKMNKKKNEKEYKPVELRLASTQEINKSKYIKYLQSKKKLSTNTNIYDSNERLYYSWYRDKNKGNINNFMKKNKLTEFAMYNKTKEKLKYGNLDDIFRNNSFE